MSKVMTRKDAETIVALLEPIDVRYSRINNGGCGFFACLLHDLLVSKGYSPKLCLLESHGFFSNSTVEEFEKALNYLKETGSTLYLKECYISHIAVYVDGYVLDVARVLSEDTIDYFIPYDLVKRLVSLKSIWNSHFDRSLIPTIKKETTKILTEATW